MAEERLQKIMAAAGIGSRRTCEKMIAAGRVKIDGRTVTEMGVKVDPESAQITVNGRPLKAPASKTYIKMYKPRHILGDVGGNDEYGRATVLSLLPPQSARLFPVGRLDLNSEGLLLLTDDGELANRLTHPRYEHPKTYYVLLEKNPGQAALNQLINGVTLPDGYTTARAHVNVVERLPAQLQLAPGPKAGCWLEIILKEGKKRQIRHMTAAVGYPTLRLVRWSIGPLTLAGLKEGKSAPLTRREVGALRQSTQAKRHTSKAPGRDKTQSKSP
ncbi:MAG: rRNA pseudouridine synthase [Caldilineaceae bacterium]|nr:rRNA pseudouridine synthase [Caldilineaceae bacterium]MCB0138483.1 rRNA pseudouridine synthase [Caldilineaceae bacterium]